MGLTPSSSGAASGALKFQPRRPSLFCSHKPHRDRTSSCISTAGRLRQRNRLDFSELSSINIWPGMNTSTTSPANGWTLWERSQARDGERLRSPSSPFTELSSDLSSTTEQHTTARQRASCRNWIEFDPVSAAGTKYYRRLAFWQSWYRRSIEIDWISSDVVEERLFPTFPLELAEM